MPGIMQGTQRPNYGRCVDVVTHQLHDATHAGGARRRHVAPAGQAPVIVMITGAVKISAVNCLRSSYRASSAAALTWKAWQAAPRGHRRARAAVKPPVHVAYRRLVSRSTSSGARGRQVRCR
jgi:hypothetical protein